MSRAPTQEQKAQEEAVLYTALADLAVTFLLATFAIATQSLTLLSEAIRCWLMLIIEFIAFLILRAVHRDRLGKFRFGIGKLEQMCNLAIGASLVLSGLWIVQHVIQSLLFDQAAATPLGLATAAVIAAINLAINALGWFAMISASRSDDSAIFKGQLRARTVKLFSSLVVQTTMTIAALAKDPMIAAGLDGLGASFVAALMVAIGFKMVWGCLPDLLDRSVPKDLAAEIQATLNKAAIAPNEIAHIRTRRAGSFPHIELTLTTTGCFWVRDFLQRAGRLDDQLRSQMPEADISIAFGAAEALDQVPK